MKQFLFWFFVIAASTAVGVVTYVWRPWEAPAPVLYEARARVMGHDDSLGWLPDNTLLSEQFARLHALAMYHVKGPPTIAQMLIDLDLKTGLAHDDKGELTASGQVEYLGLVDRLTDAITVSTDIDSATTKMVTIRVVHADPALASRIANYLAERLLKIAAEEMRGYFDDQQAFYSLEAKRWESQARLAYSELVKMRLQLPRNLDLDDPIALHDRVNATRDSRDKLKLERERLRSRRDTLLKWVDAQPDFIEITNASGAKEEAPNQEKITGQKDVVADTDKMNDLTAQLELVSAEVEQLELLVREYFSVRNEWARIQRNWDRATRYTTYWQEQLFRSEAVAALLRSGSGVRWQMIERAPAEAPRLRDGERSTPSFESRANPAAVSP